MFGSQVLLPRILGLRSSEELVARASVEFVYGPESSVSGLERAFLGSSGLVCSSLEREVRRSSELLLVADLRVRVFGSSERFLARARVSVSGRSSDQSFARASVFYISGQQRV